jgi:hypothetical protein
MVSIGIASRSFHSTPHVRSSDVPSASASSLEPITAVAKRASNQSSLEQPQNGAGSLQYNVYDKVELKIYDRIFVVIIGQDYQLGETEFNVAHDVRFDLLLRF